MMSIFRFKDNRFGKFVFIHAQIYSLGARPGRWFIGMLKKQLEKSLWDCSNLQGKEQNK